MHAWPDAALPKVPGRGPALRLFDTADAAVRPVSPGSVATMYVCGITPYDATHLGHAATYLSFDLINRIWRDLGHDVHYVQNVTDVDDPLFERATRDGEDWIALGQRETELFRTDMQALRIIAPRDYVGAVESISEVIEFVDRLHALGVAYRVDDPQYPDVYFDHSATELFGYESGLDRAAMMLLAAERGGDPQRVGKRNPLDPALWRLQRPGEPAWDSPFGPGRPGWHIECAAIAVNRLGFGFDVQGGGSDLVFPHHEFSAAHAEAVHGPGRFARHYAHAGMIGLDGEKMSKSRGNLVLVSVLRDAGVDPMAIRLALLAGHYREDRTWNDTALHEAAQRLQRWRDAFSLSAGPSEADVVARVRTHLANDLDSPKALNAVDGWVHSALTYGGDDAGAPAAMAAAVDALLGVSAAPR